METLIYWIVNDYLYGLVESFTSPQKRVSIVYLVSAIFIALVWLAFLERRFSRQEILATITRIFSKKIWFSVSARADYLLLFINKFVMAVATPFLLSRIVVTTFLYYFFYQNFGSVSGILSELPAWVAPVSYTVFLFLIDDFSRYLVHRALHQIPILWAFHKVHHTAEYLTPFTVFRTHPIEGFIFSLRSTLVQAIAISLFVFLFGSKIDLLAVYGVNVFLFIFNVAGANLRHSHISISYGKYLEKIFISPAQHQIHHSKAPQHHNKNFGVILAVWDWMGSSLCPASGVSEFEYGLSGNGQKEAHGMRYLYVSPFIEVGQYLRLKLKLLVSKYSEMRTLSGGARGLRFLFLCAFLTGTSFPSNLFSQEINIYSHRQPFLINPFIQAFEKETGIKSNIVFSSKGLAQRLLAEGKRSPADIVLTVDISRLNVYADKNLLAPVDSEILTKNIPKHLRDPENRWFGLSKRARIVAVREDRVDLSKIKRIEDLSNQVWQGRICSRPGSHVYNRALLASIIAANGASAAEQWAKGLVSNLARRPQGNDRAQLKAINQGVCDIAIINSYYFGKIRNSKILQQREWTKNVRILFTNQMDRGNHINISGGGVTKYSKNKDLGKRFLEYLSGVEAQKLYSKINYEFPSNPQVEFSEELRSWGPFVEDKLPIGEIAELAPQAQQIIDRVGW